VRVHHGVVKLQADSKNDATGSLLPSLANPTHAEAK
jgi:hypothetical protein